MARVRTVIVAPAEIAKVLKQPDAREKLSAQGVGLVGSSLSDPAKFFDGEVTRWSKVVSGNSIRAGE